MKIKLSDYIPQKLGLVYFPPAIVIRYGGPTSLQRFTHVIKLANIHLPLAAITSQIMKEHAVYFSDNKITRANLQQLIRKLKVKNGAQVDEPAARPTKEPQQARQSVVSFVSENKSSVKEQYEEQFQDFEEQQGQEQGEVAPAKQTPQQEIKHGFQFLEESDEITHSIKLVKEEPKAESKQVQKAEQVFQFLDFD